MQTPEPKTNSNPTEATTCFQHKLPTYPFLWYLWIQGQVRRQQCLPHDLSNYQEAHCCGQESTHRCIKTILDPMLIGSPFQGLWRACFPMLIRILCWISFVFGPFGFVFGVFCGSLGLAWMETMFYRQLLLSCLPAEASSSPKLRILFANVGPSGQVGLVLWPGMYTQLSQKGASF